MWDHFIKALLILLFKITGLVLIAAQRYIVVGNCPCKVNFGKTAELSSLGKRKPA